MDCFVFVGVWCCMKFFGEVVGKRMIISFLVVIIEYIFGCIVVDLVDFFLFIG